MAPGTSRIRVRLERLCRGLLRLYPPDFRQEFAAEILATISQALQAAEAHGAARLWAAALNELAALLWALPGERLHALHRRRSAKQVKFWRWEMEPKPGKSFAAWLLANLAGCAALAVLAVALPAFAPARSWWFTLLALGLTFGLAQWLGLRRIAPASAAWILTFPLGILLYLLILQAIPAGWWGQVDDESVAVLTASYLLIGLLIGLPQWLILQREFRPAWVWLPASTGGLALGPLLFLVTGLINRSGELAYVLAGVCYIAVTGLALAFLRPTRQQHSPS